MDLMYRRDFTNSNALVSFVDGFLGLNSVSCLQKFNLKFEHEYNIPEAVHVTRWVNNVIERKLQHLHVTGQNWLGEELRMPATVYTCKSLVSLNLYKSFFPNPEFVSLPCLKVIVIKTVRFQTDLVLEMLISGCPVLESLTVYWSCLLKALRVRSQSLLNFTYYHHGQYDEDLVVAIDAPMLEYLMLDYVYASFVVLESLGSLVKVDMSIMFSLRGEEFNPNDLPKRNIVRNFLIGISSVKVLNISWFTFQVISNCLRCEPLPLFGNLSFLQVGFNDYCWEVLPTFLESCRKLKSLYLGFSRLEWVERVGIVPKPRQLLTSLEYVNIVQPKLDDVTHETVEL